MLLLADHSCGGCDVRPRGVPLQGHLLQQELVLLLQADELLAQEGLLGRRQGLAALQQLLVDAAGLHPVEERGQFQCDPALQKKSQNPTLQLNASEKESRPALFNT